MQVPQKVIELVQRFDEQREAYKSPEYNETQCRREFIDPMFKALGWDMENKKGYAEQWKEVVHEATMKIQGGTKAPDYAFRLGGRRLFFLEAKKPAINLKEDPSPAYQLRRYAWTAKLPVSILTDFEEFVVYDTRVKPCEHDKASTARVLYITYDEYPSRWEEIASLFSPQAIQQGALDKYVQSSKKKRGTAEVDDAFLAEIEEWREFLARNIALRNHGLSQRQLNVAVQSTIDRIIFLRICEDRGIENYAQLQALLSGGDTYARLRVLFDRADQRYNSGLFHFRQEHNRPGQPDTLTPGLTIDDKTLKDIIKRLYYPESPYEFSVFPAEILGHVYERFLGSVIRLTAGGHAKIEEKPEVRKAGGVYYTPTYIVDYIVKHTVGKLLGESVALSGTISGADPFVVPSLGGPGRFVVPPSGGPVPASGVGKTGTVPSKRVPERDGTVPAFPEPPKGGTTNGEVASGSDGSPPPHHASSRPRMTPQDVAGVTETWRPSKTGRPLAILDPACGSGSFLLGAYQYLLDWHLEYYSNDTDKWSRGKDPRVYQNERGAWRLTTPERKRILLANIYGVDIDPQAVEVTKLSLLLKVLEGENVQRGQGDLRFAQRHMLPDLADNIKCGNSLIGPDFYQGRQTDLDDEEGYRINAFDWNAEFPQVMQSGGFDAVVGNPPYIRIQTMKQWAPAEVEFYRGHYRAATAGNYDIYVVFVEKGLSLLSENGRLGFICPHKFFNAKYGAHLRELIAKGRHLSEVVHFGDQQIFHGATTYTCLLFLHKPGASACRFVQVMNLEEWRASGTATEGPVEAVKVTASDWNFVVGRNAFFFDKLSQMPVKLGDVAERLFQGLVTGCDPVFILTQVAEGKYLSAATEEEHFLEDELMHPLCKGSVNIRRFHVSEITKSILFPYELVGGRALLLPSQALRERFPHAWGYLRTIHSDLIFAE